MTTTKLEPEPALTLEEASPALPAEADLSLRAGHQAIAWILGLLVAVPAVLRIVNGVLGRRRARPDATLDEPPRTLERTRGMLGQHARMPVEAAADGEA